LLPSLNHDSHHPNKVNFSIPCINTRSTRAHIEEALSDLGFRVAYTTTVLEIDCDSRKWYIGSLLQRSKKKCQVLQASTKVACKSKVGKGPHGTPTPTYKGMKTENCIDKQV
jgi:hypothetical protein